MAPGILDFLLARIAEDEECAEMAAHFGSAKWGEDAQCWHLGGDKHIPMTDTETRHIARHDPLRVLAECEAKRRIVESVEAILPRGTNGLGPSVLRHLALPYAEHPDYRPEWKP